MQRWIDRNTKWILTLPLILFIVIMVAYPLYYTFDLSLHTSTMSAVKPPKFVGFANYEKMFRNSRFIDSCEKTLLFSGVCLISEMLLGLTLALILNRTFKGQTFVRTLFILPIVATPVAVAMVWKMMYDPALGVFNLILKEFGMQPYAFLGERNTALWALMLVEIWQNTPMVMLICLGGLAAIPTDSLEASEIDGASKWQRLTRITLPLLSPTILTAMMLRLIDVLKAYDIIYSTTQGGPGTATQTINVLAYRQAFENFKFGEASATIVVFFLILVVISVAFNAIRKRTVVDY